MTEAEWLACQHPTRMLTLVGGGLAGDRKCRLFAVACCRLVAEALTANALAAIDAQEAFADGQIDEQALQAAIDGVKPPKDAQRMSPSELIVSGFLGPVPWLPGEIIRPRSVAEWTSRVAADAALSRIRSGPRMETWQGRSWIDRGRVGPLENPESNLKLAIISMRKAQADLLREIFGNPSRPSTLDPSWLTWDGGTIPDLARAIYEEKAFDRMPILGDALEEAGCSDADILGHCRGEGIHVRGCWVLDSLLGRH